MLRLARGRTADKEFSTYYRSVVRPCPPSADDDYPMLWQSRSSSRIDAASLLAANSSSSATKNSSGTSTNSSDGVTQLSLAQRARLCSSTSNLQRVITTPAVSVNEKAAHRQSEDNVDESTSSLNSTDAIVFSTPESSTTTKNKPPSSDTVTQHQKQQKSFSTTANGAVGGSAVTTSSLGRYASKLKSQLPPLHFGFENKKQASNSSTTAQNSTRSVLQRSSSGKTPPTSTTTASKPTAEQTASAVSSSPTVNNPADVTSSSPLHVTETLGGKISRSIYDLTSIERLRNWKAKLPSIRNSKHHNAGTTTTAATLVTPTINVEKSSGIIAENQLDNEEHFSSGVVPTFSDIPQILIPPSTTTTFQQVVNGEKTLNGKNNIKYDLTINTSTPSTTIPTVNSNQFHESSSTSLRQTATATAPTTNDGRIVVENGDSGSRSCATENRSNSNFLAQNSDPSSFQRNFISATTAASVSDSHHNYHHISGTDTPIRYSIGLLLAQTESIVSMASSSNNGHQNVAADNIMNTSKTSVESAGKIELQTIFGQKKLTDDENKVYEEIDFPGWYKNGKDNKNGHQLPPPARITPFSGIPQNKMGEVVRPTAFRPFTTSTGVSTDQQPKRPTTFQQSNAFDHFVMLTGFQETSGGAFHAPPLPPPRQALAPVSPAKQYPSDTEAERYFINSFNYNKPDPPKYPSDGEAGSFYTSYHQRVAPHGPKYFPQETNFRHSPNTNVKQRGTSSTTSSSSKHHTNSYIFANGDHDYDLVIATPNQDAKNNNLRANHLFPASSNEFLQKRPLPSLPSQKHSSLGATNSLPGGYQNQPQLQQQQTQIVSNADNGQSAPNYYSTTGSYSSRNSSGIHVTPSPSDSGMVDLETVLKEKEAELLQLRQTMEHNEQVIVRVYQEKEERWQDKLREWASRLEQAVSTEQKLLSQIQRLQDDRTELQAKVQSLAADKQGLQRKCKELESELFSLKQQIQQNKDTQWEPHCSRCDNALSRQSTSQATSPDVNSIGRKKSPTPAEELRTEVDGLKDEVANLRKSLHDQVYKFSHERKSWEIEKQRVLQYHKILQDSYSQLLRQNGVPNPILTENANFLQQSQIAAPNTRIQKT